MQQFLRKISNLTLIIFGKSIFNVISEYYNISTAIEVHSGTNENSTAYVTFMFYTSSSSPKAFAPLLLLWYTLTFYSSYQFDKRYELVIRKKVRERILRSLPFSSAFSLAFLCINDIFRYTLSWR